MADQESPRGSAGDRPSRPGMPGSYGIDRGDAGMIPWTTSRARPVRTDLDRQTPLDTGHSADTM
jgi:hypothetical protein